MPIELPGRSNSHTGSSSLRSWLLVGMILLAMLGALIGPKGCWYLRATTRLEQLSDEVRRLGGQTHVLEGEIDFQHERIGTDLDLNHARIIDDEFARIATLPGFQSVNSLNLADTPITDRSVELLRNNMALVRLDLSRTKVTDNCLDSLAAIPGLYVLKMSGTSVSDAGLEVLSAKLPPGASMMLDVTDTAVTEEGVRKLSKKFSQWNIIYGPSKSPKTTK
jgi:hypothetical protein